VGEFQYGLLWGVFGTTIFYFLFNLAIRRWKERIDRWDGKNPLFERIEIKPVKGFKIKVDTGRLKPLDLRKVIGKKWVGKFTGSTLTEYDIGKPKMEQGTFEQRSRPWL